MKTVYFLAAFIILFTSDFILADSVNVVLKFSSSDAKSVSAAGSFNGWNPKGFDFHKSGSQWEISFKVLPGYYYYKLVVDGSWIPDPENSVKINDGDDSFNSILKAGDPPVPKRTHRSARFPKEKLPHPFLKDNPEFTELYYAAWNMAWQKIMKGTPGSGMAPLFMDEGFNEMIYQWDTCFMTIFAMYGLDAFPVMASLDNFYNKQRSDGYIQRVYNQETGQMAQEPSADEPMVNPPLFAWIELKFFKMTSDSSRLSKVLPHLVNYYKWIDKNCKSKTADGLFYTSPLGSGMDNTPRINLNKGGWIDFSAQQALAAKCISEIAGIVSLSSTADEFMNLYHQDVESINRHCWNSSKGFYFDVTEDDTLCNTVHIGAYWTLLSHSADSVKAASLINYLNNPLHFKRPHMIPTLSYSDKHFEASGHYWLGSVWAPTNYMTIKGLEEYGYYKLADDISLNHIKNICEVFKSFTPSEDSIAYEERYHDGYKTIWECYSSEKVSPATRWDNTFYSRQDFVGWSGLGPISLLIENVLGIDVNGRENKITWRIHRSDEHGISNLSLRKQKVDLRFIPGNKNVIKVKAEAGFELIVNYNGSKRHFIINKGTQSLYL